jgi:hypothetical protein
MFRRVICCALMALAIFGAIPSTVRAAAGGAVAASYRVAYRKPGTSAWIDFRSYSTAKEAQGASRALYQKGWEVQVLARTTLTHVPARPKTADLPLEKTVTLTQARQIFAWMAAQRDIAFRYPVDGCYARAHLMIQRMQSKGYKPYKVWSFANGESLYVSTKLVRSGHVTWGYHVAPVLRLRLDNGKQAWAVIDPSLFRGPVKIVTWKTKQKRPGSRYEPYITVTAVGVAPKDATGHRLPGSGYWPGPDPREGTTKHALARMAEYKRREPGSGSSSSGSVIARAGNGPPGPFALVGGQERMVAMMIIGSRRRPLAA